VQIAVAEAARAPGALGDVVAGQLEVHATEAAAAVAMDAEGQLEFAEDRLEAARLDPVVGGAGVAVHRVADPQRRASGAGHRLDQRRQFGLDRRFAEAVDQRHATRLVFGVDPLEQLEQRLRGEVRADLDADRVADAAQVLDVCSARVDGACAEPGQVGREVVPAGPFRGGAGLRLLVGQQQRLMAGVEIDPTRVPGRLARDGLHEVQRAADFGDHPTVLRRGRRQVHELEVPVLRVVKVCETAVDQGADEVQRQRRARVTTQHVDRIRGARFGGELGPVDQVAAVRGERHAVTRLEVGGARLGVLAREAPDTGDATLQPVHQHQAHLQQDLELVGDDLRGAVTEVLGAVASVQQEALAGRRLCELPAQRLDLPAGHQRGQPRDLGDDLVDRGGIGVIWLLQRREPAPAVGGPLLHIDRPQLRRRRRSSGSV
jgi:hypothetical protein